MRLLRPFDGNRHRRQDVVSEEEVGMTYNTGDTAETIDGLFRQHTRNGGTLINLPYYA